MALTSRFERRIKGFAGGCVDPAVLAAAREAATGDQGAVLDISGTIS
jgi:hypothetical protein